MTGRTNDNPGSGSSGARTWLVDGKLPGRRHRCRACNRVIVFARTVATDRGRGGKLMPLDLEPHPDGNVGARMHGRDLVCEVLSRDCSFDPSWARAMPHFATCGSRGAAREDGRRLADDIETWLRETTGGATP
ncbi:hypothetical protein [Nocardioides marmoraquaticus]